MYEACLIRGQDMKRERCTWCGSQLPTAEDRARRICPPCVDSVVAALPESATAAANARSELTPEPASTNPNPSRTLTL